MNASNRSRRIMFAIIVAAMICSALFLAVELCSSFSTGNEPVPRILTIYFLSLAIMCSPYLLLLQVVRIERRLALVVVELLAVILPAPIVFLAWRNSEGFSFLVVPLQLILSIISLTISLVLDRRESAETTTRL